MKKAFKSICFLFIGLLLFGCDDVKKDDFNVWVEYPRGFSKTKLHILYQGEGDIAITKVTANRGNCVVTYGAGFGFKDGYSVVSGETPPKACYEDIRKHIASLLSSEADEKLEHSCTGLSYMLKQDLSKQEVFKVDVLPYSQEKRKVYDEMLKAYTDYITLYNNHFIHELEDILKVKVSQDYYDNFYNYTRDLFGSNYITATMPKILSNFSQDWVERYNEIRHEKNIEPLNQDEIKQINKLLDFAKRYDEIEKSFYEYENKIPLGFTNFNINFNGLEFVNRAWEKNENASLHTYDKNNHMQHYYVPPYHSHKIRTYLTDEEIKAIRELEKKLYYDYATELRYGNEAIYEVSNCSSVLEVEITTNKGKVTISKK